MSKRSGTENRRRTHLIGVRLDDVERGILDELCSKYDMSPPELLRDGLDTLWSIEQQLVHTDPEET